MSDVTTANHASIHRGDALEEFYLSQILAASTNEDTIVATADGGSRSPKEPAEKHDTMKLFDEDSEVVLYDVAIAEYDGDLKVNIYFAVKKASPFPQLQKPTSTS